MGYSDKSLSNIDLEENLEEFYIGVNEFIKGMHTYLEKKNKPLHGDIKFKFLNHGFIYNTEEENINTFNELGIVKIDKNNFHSESDIFSSKRSYFSRYNKEKEFEYKKEIREIDDKIRQRDTIKTNDASAQAVLLEEGYLRLDKHLFYMETEKTMNDLDIIDDFSSEFKSSNTYDYIKNKYVLKENYSNLYRIKEYAKMKMVTLILFKKMKQKFLKKSKTKGYRKNK